MKFSLEGFGRQVDGEYEWPEDLTRREWRTLKQVADVRPLELQKALQVLDQDVLIAFAMVALARAGKPVPEDVFLDASGDSTIRLIEDEVAEEERPPTSATPSGPESEPDVAENDSEKNESSGQPTSDDSATQETNLRAVGGLT